MNKIDTMTQKEKVMGFAYVVILFLLISVVCCMTIFLYNSNFGSIERKEYFVGKMKRIGEYRNDQKQYTATIDLLYKKINEHNPGVLAIYEEDNIKFLLNDLRDMYEHKSIDTRYRSFLHIADFYYIWYADKRTLWTLNNNIDIFTKNLEECELGLANKKDDFAKLRR
jgi:hypothetical protein